MFMQNETSTLQKSRIAFLLLLTIGISLLFFWVIADFVLTLVMATVLAGLTYPAYRQFVLWLRGREAAAATVTVLLTLLVLLTTLGGLVLFGAAGIVIGPIVGALFTTVWAIWGRQLRERTEVRDILQRR